MYTVPELCKRAMSQTQTRLETINRRRIHIRMKTFVYETFEVRRENSPILREIFMFHKYFNTDAYKVIFDAI